MINATQMGQLATEYLYDRKEDFKMLEKQVTKDIMRFKADVEKAQTDCAKASGSLRFLIRRDVNNKQINLKKHSISSRDFWFFQSDINVGRVRLPKEENDLELEESIQDLENVLNFLQRSTAVENYENIFPW